MTATVPAPAPPSAGGGSGRSLSWDVVRVLAVLSVVVQHATYTVTEVVPWLEPPPFSWDVFAGANTLMVVSGYFVCVTLAKRAPGRWWWNRVARLLPAYAVAVVVTYLATRLAARYGYWEPGVRDLVGNLLLVQTWDPTITYIDHSYWTLPLQLGVFTLAALAVLAGRRGGVWRRRGVLPAVAWAGVVVPVVLGWWAEGAARTVFEGLVIYRWHLFAVGLAVWLAARGRLARGHLALLLAAGVVAEYLLEPDLASAAVLAVGLAGVAAAALGPDWGLLRVGAKRKEKNSA